MLETRAAQKVTLPTPTGCQVPGNLRSVKPEALQSPLPTAAAAECREDLKILRLVGPQGPPFRRALANVLPALSTSRRTGVSGPGNRRNLTWIVRLTRAIGIAAVLALSGHGCHHVARRLVHLAEDRKVRSLIEAGRVGPDHEEL
jgi:hypothetical protein